jgi:hypothetical protein
VAATGKDTGVHRRLTRQLDPDSMGTPKVAGARPRLIAVLNARG